MGISNVSRSESDLSAYLLI